MAKLVDGIDVKKLLKGPIEFEVNYNNTFDSDLDIDDKAVEVDYFEKASEYLNLDCLQVKDDDEYNREPFENLARKMTDLTPCGKIKKRIIREGYGELPQNNCRVRVDYNAYVELEAIPFDSTYARKRPFDFSLDEGITGFQMAVKSMRVNEKSHFLVHSDFAFKDSGLTRIPPNSTVLFEIEVRAFIQDNSDKVERIKEFSDVIKYCTAITTQAKGMFELKNYKGALNQYSIGLKKLEDAHLYDWNDQIKYDEMLLKLHTNMLVCATILEIPKKGCIHANEIISLARNGTIKIPSKVFFNNAKCLAMLGDYKTAINRLKRGKRMEPKNKEITKFLSDLQELIRKQNCSAEEK